MNRNQIARDILASCDEEYGAQFRNGAIEKANAMIAGYEVDRPRSEIQMYKLMRRAYAELAAKESARTEPASPKPAAERSTPFKPGSLAEVRRDIAARMKAGTYRPFAT